MGDIADVYRKKGDFGIAEGFYFSCLKIVKEKYGDSHAELAQVYENIGLLLKKESKYIQALEYYSLSLNIIRSIFGTSHYKYASCINNLGDLSRKVCFPPSSFLSPFSPLSLPFLSFFLLLRSGQIISLQIFYFSFALPLFSFPSHSLFSENILPLSLPPSPNSSPSLSSIPFSLHYYLDSYSLHLYLLLPLLLPACLPLPNKI